jgi:predicted acylesterase/phospholipase RssA
MSVWGPLAERFDGKENTQHKLLTIDGGGIRGVMALAILAGLEKKLAAAHGVPEEDFRLCDFFDYVAGTSTGAVIAASVACRLPLTRILQFYCEAGPSLFDNSLRSQARNMYKVGSRFDATILERELQEIFGAERTLEPEHLKCLMLAVTRNQTTDSPWPISSNPQAKYNDPARDDSNLKMEMWRFLRASTAAPLMFHAQQIKFGKKKVTNEFSFVDGGVTPHNNPAWLLFRMATEPGYRLNWATGEDKMMIVSVGTGTSPKGDGGVLPSNSSLKRLLGSAKIVGAMIQGAMVDQDTNCRHVGRCVYGEKMDSEIGDMIPRDANGERIPLSQDLGRKFLYARYNAALSSEGLKSLGLGHINPKHVEKLNSVEFIDELMEIGTRVAEDINLDHFSTFMPGLPG